MKECLSCKKTLKLGSGLTIFHNDRSISLLCSKCHRAKRKKSK